MARYTGPVCRLCRRYGDKLYLKGDRCMGPKCAFERRPNPPGHPNPTMPWVAGRGSGPDRLVQIGKCSNTGWKAKRSSDPWY